MIVKSIMNQILQDLCDPSWFLSEKELDRLYDLSETVEIICSEPSDPFIKISLCCESGDRAVDVEVKNRSQVIDVVPCSIGGKLRNIKPVMVLRKAKSDEESWRIEVMHEVCHLFSVGPYAAQEKNGIRYYRHTYGINEYIYKAEDTGLRRVKYDGNEVINEIMNDFVVSHFMFRDQASEHYRYQALKTFQEYIKASCERTGYSENDLVRWYFTGCTQQLKNVLLGESHDGYDQLCETLNFPLTFS